MFKIACVHCLCKGFSLGYFKKAIVVSIVWKAKLGKLRQFCSSCTFKLYFVS